MYSLFADYTFYAGFLNPLFIPKKIFWTYDNIFCGCDDEDIQVVVRDTAIVHRL